MTSCERKVMQLSNRTTKQVGNIRLSLLWSLFVLKLIVGLIIIKTVNQLLVYMVCTFLPLVAYQGVQGYRIQFLIRDYYPQVLVDYPQLATVSTTFIDRRIEEKLESTTLQKELAFLRRLRFLCTIWGISYIIYVISL